MGVLGRTEKGTDPERNEREAPHALWIRLHRYYDFTMDCCASISNHKLDSYCHEGNSFLDRLIHQGEVLWINPPFDNRAGPLLEHAFRSQAIVVGIYKSNSPETAATATIFKYASWIFQPSQRIQYEMQGKPILSPEGKIQGATFPSMLFGCRCTPPPGEVFGMSGRLLTHWTLVR